ncbi:SBBP repeat-containing protein [Aureispira sp. CCB-E]|uniref:DUF7948 domain-containing protein n=1 Tax=Aureispira sp. CCB-E TaxID=3051121 RepID=UPI0028695DF1|nr:SBBP repeat-containing protein [Aureispira sp. CCB-E]WMX16944.1 SBBP repeat-containing protein [Aureispira sp. CCB-E]
MKLFSFLLLFCTLQISYGQGVSLAQGTALIHSGQSTAFEENKGQIRDIEGNRAPYVHYRYKQGGTSVFMLSTGIAYQFSKVNDVNAANSNDNKWREASPKSVDLETYRMDMRLVGANSNAIIKAEEEQENYINYYNENRLDIHSYGKLIYKDIYPGIDWVVYTTDKGLKYDFVVHPGADPAQIQLAFEHHEGLQLNKNGSFTLSNSMGTITEQAPVSFQGKKEVRSSFELEGNSIRFKLGNYDPTKALIIDPSLIWSTYYGGSDLDRITGCATDANGNIFVSGYSRSTSNIASGGHQNAHGSGTEDAFLVKFNSNGVRQWATYYGGTGSDIGNGCAVDPSGNIYLAGYTRSTNNIASSGHQNTYGGGEDAFLVKFNTNGTRQWATYYGGIGSDVGDGCAIDANGNVFIVGRAQSTSSIASGGHQNIHGGGTSDAFLVKFNSNGTRQWATYYGGADTEIFLNCTADANGNSYITGITRSANNIASSGHQNTYGGGEDAFLVKFNSNGVRQWGTYYGTAGDDNGNACVADANGNIFLIGSTESTTNMASGGHQNTYGGGSQDAFLVKFNSSGVRQWGTYYGGSSSDVGGYGTIHTNGNIFLGGFSASTSNIASGGHQNTHGGSQDAFLVEFNTNGVRQWATYLGGSASDIGRGCVVDANGHVYLAGHTSSTSGIALSGHQNTYGGGFVDGFLAKLTTTTSTACNPTTNSISATACGSYTYNGQTYTNSGVYMDTLTNAGGCDSIVTLNLTIGGATYDVSAITYTSINATGGTSVNLGDDALSASLPIGFDFNFFGNTYNDFRISSNGFITFGTNTTTSGCCSGQVLPNTNQPNNLIALFWEDLLPPNGGTIRYLTAGTAPNRVLVVEFVDIEHHPSGDSVQGQIHIYESTNIIEVHVAKQPAAGRHTLGIENGTGVLGYSAPNRNGIAWTIATPEAWRFAPVVGGVDVQTACSSYTWIDGKTYTSSNNTATHIIQGGSWTGCDSVVQLDLIIYNTPGGNGTLSENMEGGALISGTGYSRELTNAYFYNPNNISEANFSSLEGSLYGYGQTGGFVNSDRSIRFRTYAIPAGNEMAIVMKKVDLDCNAQVSFSYAHQNYLGNVDTMQVEVSTDCGATWTTVWMKSGADLATAGASTSNFLPPFTASDWVRDTADLSAYSNMPDVIVKFTVLSGYGNNIYLDDINITSSLGYATRTVTACNSYSFNGQVYMNSGIYVDTVSTPGTCDSVITLDLTINNSTTGTDVQTACDTYTWIDGNTYTSSNNTATHTLTNAAGCDSVVTLNLTINNSTTGTDVQTACDTYTWIDGNTYTSSNNTATHTLTNAAGCDSVVTLNLTINNSTTGTDVQTACDTYTWIDGNTYTSSNNTATHTLTNAVGCDSVVTLNLTINNSTTGTDVQTACNTYTWIDGNTYTSSNNTATHTLTNAAGCDSVVTLNLTINTPTTGTDVQTACNTYTWIDGNTYTSSNNTATHTLTNAVGCDSVVTLNLTINTPTTGTDVQTACDTYTWIDGNTYTSSNNTVTHTLTNAVGCDSVVTLNLTINNSTTGTDVQTACDTYTWIDGNTYTSSNNTATHILTNAAGCDSVVTLNLTINNSTTGTDVQTACDTYTWIDGNTYTSSNNTATHTLTNAVGCDSVVTLNLTINTPTTGTDVQTACNTYTWIDGNTYTSSNNTATHTLTNAAGCDSVVTLNLTINTPTTGTDVQTACDTYTWIDGNTYTSSNNTATHTLTNAAGCDSVVTLNLTINNSTTGTDVQTACDTYTWIDGNTYTSSNNTATHTLTNAAGCDSVVTLNLTITTVDTTVSQNGLTLTANQSGATYQWVDCNNGNTAIAGATGQSFTPVANGDYAVMITFNNCTGTSSCFNVVVNALPTVEEGIKQVRVYPNPTTGQVNIELEEVLKQGVARLMDVNGRLLLEQSIDGKQFIQLNIEALPTAVYFLELQSLKGVYSQKIIKE